MTTASQRTPVRDVRSGTIPNSKVPAVSFPMPTNVPMPTKRMCAVSMVLAAMWLITSFKMFEACAWGQYGLYGAPQPLPWLDRQVSPTAPAVLAETSTHAGLAWQCSGLEPASQPPAPLPRSSAQRPYVDFPLDQALPEPADNPGMSASLLESGRSFARGPSEYGAGVRAEVSPTSPLYPDTSPYCGCYGPSTGVFGNLQGGWWQSGCADDCRWPWFGYVGALVMGRDEPNRVWLSHQYSSDGRYDAMQLGHTDGRMPWRWGGEVRCGRYFGCGAWAVEATYWTLDAFTTYRQVFPVYYDETEPLGLGTPLQFQQVYFGAQNPANSAENWFGNGAREHRLWRRNELHNVEINVIRNRLWGQYNSPLAVDWLAGARFLRFEENLLFASLRNGYQWSQPDGQAYLDIDVANNLWGFQLGFNADWWWAGNLRFFLTPKFGLYNNHIRQHFHIYRGDGVAGSGIYGAFPVDSSRDVFSFLTEVNLGLDWQLTRRLSATIGYRLLVATGIGLADHQFPQYMVDIPEIASMHTNGHLLLHGAFMGLTYNY